MLWVHQQYHNAILDCQKQNNLFKTNDWRAPVQHKHKTFDVIKPTEKQAPILQSDLYHASLLSSCWIVRKFYFWSYTIFVQYLNAICRSKCFRPYCGKALIRGFCLRLLDLGNGSQRLCDTGTRLHQSKIWKSLFSVDSQELHCGIVDVPKACRLTMGL